MSFTTSDYEKAVRAIKQFTEKQPDFGLVLGSGLGKLADTFEDKVVIPSSKIPGWPQSTVEGHSGNLVIGQLEGKTVIAQQGRSHFYEGYSPQEITFPIRVMHFLGVKTLILTNAAGGLNTSFNVGDVMLINDHINFIGMVGNNPLIGTNDSDIGPRFPPMTHTYDRELRDVAQKVAKETNIILREGVYVCLSGPTFESPAEVRMLRILGGDAVGMSTVHEVIVARHAGIKVMAYSGITNICVDSIESTDSANHEEVLESGKVIVPKLAAILKGVLRAS